MDWPIYLALISDNAAGVRIAERTGIPESTISRWLSGKANPNPRQVALVARAYGEHPVSALMAAGYLDEEDLDREFGAPTRGDIRQFTDLELAEEMVRRIAAGQSGVLTDPLDENHPAMKQVQPGSAEE